MVSVFLLLICVQGLMAQTRIVSGTIKDTNGDAIIGATVAVKGTTQGTVTDESGNFSLGVAGNATSIIVTYIGYKTQEIALGASNVINATLEEDVLGLDQVVVTAIGISSQKKSLGYSVQDVGGDALTKSGESNTLNALGGKVAGLQVISSSGAPGSSVYLELRGATSITGDNSPLLVVDGVPLNNSMISSGNPDFGSNNLLNSVNNSNRGIDINPDDIESITVLKGPSATALYGINAANGAIIITTKKGGNTSGGVHVTYSTNYSWEQVNKLPELQSTFVKGSLNNPSSYESGSSGSWGPSYDSVFWNTNSPTKFDTHGQLTSWANAHDSTGALIDGMIPFVPYDNVDQFFRTGNTFENNLALSGGNDNSTYRFSFSSLSQNGIVPLSDFTRYTAKLSGSANLSTKFSASGSVSYIKSGGQRVQQGSNLSGLMLDLLRTPISFDNSNGSSDPTEDSAYIFSDGTQRNYRGGGGYDNPYWTINQNPFIDDVNRMYGFGQIDYDATSWLKLTYRLGTDFYTDHRNQFFAINSRALPSGQVFTQDEFYRHFNSDLLATATHDFSEDLTGNLTVGTNMYAQTTRSSYTEGDNLNFASFNNFSVASDILTRQSSSQYRTAAAYLSGQLAYKSMLYLNLTARNEMSSTLPTGANSFLYPSASLAWVFSESLGMTDNKTFSYGKIRVSYAQVGKDASPYSLQSYYTQASSGDGWTGGIAFPMPHIVGADVASANAYNIVGFTAGDVLGNPNLKPEKTNSTEFGTDLRFLNNRIGVDFTYYNSKSIDQILPVPIAGSTGYSFQVVNTGSIQNKGMEIMLNISPVKTDNFNWDLSLNWSHNHSEVLSLSNGVNELFMGGFEGSAIYAVVGQQFGSIYGSRWLRDENGNVVINDDANSSDYGRPIQDASVGVIGDINPDWIGGITNTLTYKGVALSFLIDIRQGGDIWNGTKGALTFFGRTAETENRGTTNTFEGVLGHYDANGDLVHYDSNLDEVAGAGGTNTVVTTLDQSWYKGLGSGFNGPAEQFVEDGSYVRLRELSLSYSLKSDWLNGTPFGSVDISFTGRNLWLSTKYSGVDPETSLTGSNNSQGMDYFNMPNTKSYGLSLKVTL